MNPVCWSGPSNGNFAVWLKVEDSTVVWTWLVELASECSVRSRTRNSFCSRQGCCRCRGHRCYVLFRSCDIIHVYTCILCVSSVCGLFLFFAIALIIQKLAEAKCLLRPTIVATYGVITNIKEISHPTVILFHRSSLTVKALSHRELCVERCDNTINEKIRTIYISILYSHFALRVQKSLQLIRVQVFL